MLVRNLWAAVAAQQHCNTAALLTLFATLSALYINLQLLLSSFTRSLMNINNSLPLLHIVLILCASCSLLFLLSLISVTALLCSLPLPLSAQFVVLFCSYFSAGRRLWGGTVVSRQKLVALFGSLCVDLLRFCFDFNIRIPRCSLLAGPDHYAHTYMHTHACRHTHTQRQPQLGQVITIASEFAPMCMCLCVCVYTVHFRFQLGLIKQTIDHIDLLFDSAWGVRSTDYGLSAVRCLLLLLLPSLPGLLLAFHFPVLVFGFA